MVQIIQHVLNLNSIKISTTSIQIQCLLHHHLLFLSLILSRKGSPSKLSNIALPLACTLPFLELSHHSFTHVAAISDQPAKSQKTEESSKAKGLDSSATFSAQAKKNGWATPTAARANLG
jgi:hypothetical protein